MRRSTRPVVRQGPDDSRHTWLYIIPFYQNLPKGDAPPRGQIDAGAATVNRAYAVFARLQEREVAALAALRERAALAGVAEVLVPADAAVQARRLFPRFLLLL